MSLCADFELLLASDEAADRARAAEHALACADCRAILGAQKRLQARVDAWTPAVAPPPELEDRIQRAVSRRLAAPMPQKSSNLSWIALAAGLLLAVGVGFGIGMRPLGAPTEAEDLLVASALRDARRAESEHARVIARLEEAVAPRLARAENPDLPAAEAAQLLALREQISSLESTIDEIQGYLRENPAHPGARTVLLAAYRDKTEVLREVLALGEST